MQDLDNSLPLGNPQSSSDCPRLNGNFAAIDFETANNERSSVCSVGLVIVRGGEIVDRFYSLIKPEPEYYNYWCSRVHGLCAADTENAPVFPEIWMTRAV